MKLLHWIIRNYHLRFNPHNVLVIKITEDIYKFGDVIYTSTDENYNFKYLGNDFYLAIHKP